MQQGLRAKGEDEDVVLPLMVSGSQMVVLTDAPSKQKELEAIVISEAVRLKVCIHFFVSDDYALGDGIYRRIATQTHGILHEHFSHWDIATFAAAYDIQGCHFLKTLRKRRLVPSSRCEIFAVSRLAALLKLSIKADTGNIITVTRSNKTVTTLVVRANNLALLTEANPVSGEWSACTSAGNIEVSDVVNYIIDTTVLYLNNGSVSSTAPPACKSVTMYAGNN